MSKSKVLKCECKHEEQDILYGKGMRLHSLSPDGKKAYCTVCSEKNRTKTTTSEPKEKHKICGMIQDQVVVARKYKSI